MLTMMLTMKENRLVSNVDKFYFSLFSSNDACRMTSHTRRFKDSRFTSEEEEEEIDGCVAGTAGMSALTFNPSNYTTFARKQ